MTIKEKTESIFNVIAELHLNYLKKNLSLQAKKNLVKLWLKDNNYKPLETVKVIPNPNILYIKKKENNYHER